MKHLLDVNVLLALCYEKHVHHWRAEGWLRDLAKHGMFVSLATCSVTELGFVRVACVGERLAENVRSAISDLKQMKRQRQFIFLEDGISAEELPHWVVKPKHVTDGYLLALAASYGGHLVTLDKGIPGALKIPEGVEDDTTAVREPAVPYEGRIYPARVRAASAAYFE